MNKRPGAAGKGSDMLWKAQVSWKTRLAGLAVTALVITLITLLSPIEQTLGAGIRLIYFHGAWVWAGIITFGLAAVAGLLGLLLRRAWPRWSRMLGLTGLFFWLTYLPLSLRVQQIFWGGLFLDEPRWRIPFAFAVAGVLLQLALWLMNLDWLTCLANLAFGALLYINLLPADTVLHPDSPVFGSGSLRIQAFWLALLLLALTFGAQLALWLFHARRQPR